MWQEDLLVISLLPFSGSQENCLSEEFLQHWIPHSHKFPQPANSTLSSLVPPQVTVNFWKRGQLFYNSYSHIISKKSNPKALSQNICWCHGGFPLACKSFLYNFHRNFSDCCLSSPVTDANLFRDYFPPPPPSTSAQFRWDCLSIIIKTVFIISAMTAIMFNHHGHHLPHHLSSACRPLPHEWVVRVRWKQVAAQRDSPWLAISSAHSHGLCIIVTPIIISIISIIIVIINSLSTFAKANQHKQNPFMFSFFVVSDRS